MMKIQIRPLKDPAKPNHHFIIEYRNREGKRRRQFFKTKKAAEYRVDELEADHKSLGFAASDLDEKTKREVVQCLEKLKPTGGTLTDAVAYYLKHLEATQKSETVEVVNALFLEAKERGGRSVRHLQDLKYRMGLFVATFGDKHVSEINTRMLNEWLAGLNGAPQSKTNTRRVVSGFFSYAVSNGYAIENPVLKCESFKGNEVRRPGIFTPGEMLTMLSMAEGDILASLAIGAFAGLRDSEIARLDWRQFNWETLEIDLRPMEAKNRAAHRLVKIEPNLAKWLEPYRFARGPVREANWQKRIKAFKARLASPEGGKPVKWVSNGLRHSFASYHIAHWRNSGQTSHELGHSNAALVQAHYKNTVTSREAAEWWSLEPDQSGKVVRMDATR